MLGREKSPFEVDLRCNISIEVNVAMRLGDLIRASGTEDKQLVALSYKLSNAMKYLADNLDDRQWEKFSAYMEEQSSSSDSDEDHYSNNAQRTVSEIESSSVLNEYQKDFANPRPRTLKSIVRSVVSKD